MICNQISDSPVVSAMNNVTAVEYDPSVQLRCTANSKPTAIFKWYKVENTKFNVVLTGNGTTQYNGLNLTIRNPTRQDAGIYKCEADNGFASKDSKDVELVINCKYKITQVQLGK